MEIKRPLAFGIGLTLANAACAGGGDGGEAKPETATTTTINTDGPKIETEFYESGIRIIDYVGEGGYYSDILLHCDGLDLLEQSSFNKFGYGAAGGSIERSVGHAACLDGKLTPDDFPSL